MALQSSAFDGDGKTDRTTVFIDTNLDTHLAMISCQTDTISDLKKRIMLEHLLCFPKIGHIQIHAIKVKRKGHFYHLSDSMLVTSAFSGFNKNWFLSVDASAVMEHEKTLISNSPGSSNHLACHGIANNASVGAVDVPLSSKRVSELNCFKLPQLENGHDEKEEVPFISPRASKHSRKGVVDKLETVLKPCGTDDTVIPSPASIPDGNDQCVIHDELPSATKKHESIEEKDDMIWDDICKDNNASVLGLGILTAQQKGNIVPKNPSENASREFSYGTMGENHISDEICVNSKKTSSIVQMSNEAFKETEAPKEHAKCNNNSKKNSDDVECDNSMTEPSEGASTKNNTCRKRKRSSIQDLKEEMLKVESASEQADVHKSNEEEKKIEEPNKQVETNNDKSGDRTEFQYDKVSQEPSDTGSPAKKKRKEKGSRGHKRALKEKRSLIGDSNKETLKPENASQNSLDDLPKIKDSSADLSTEQFGIVDPLGISVLGSKRKRKKNSSNNHQAAVNTSSRNDDAEESRIYSEGFQEDILKDGQISKADSVSKIAGDNLEIRTNRCKEVAMSKEKTIVNSKDHGSIDVRVHPSDLNETKELTEDNSLHMHEHITVDHGHLSEAGQTVLDEKGRDISPLDDPKNLLSENCTPSNHNNTDAKAKGTTEFGKSKKRRKKINAKDAACGPLLIEGSSHVDVSESNTVLMELCQTTNYDPTSGNTKTDENLLNQTEGENVSPEEMKGAYLSTIDKEANDINVGSLENISKTEACAENLNEKRSKNSKTEQTPNTESLSERLTKDQILDLKEPSTASDSRPLLEPLSKKKKKSRSTSTKSIHKSSGQILETKRDFIETELPHSPSNEPKGNYKSSSGANDTAINSVSSFGHEDDNHLKAPTKTETINTDQHLASGLDQDKDTASDDILVDKNGADRTDIDLMTGKNRKESEVKKGNVHTRKLRSTQQLLSKEGDGLVINPDEKVLKGRRTGQKAHLPTQSNSITSTSEEKKRPQVNKSSGKSMNVEKNTEAFPISNAKLKGLEKMVQNKVGKASGNTIEGVVSKKEQKKSLLAGTIFKDDSSSSSEDKDEKDNDSSSSTRSPSDISQSSDYSDDDSDTGSSDGTGLETGGKSHLKSSLSGTKAMPIESILRSSSRYKKAKLTASQLEETDSQSVDLVPDSLADT